MKKRKMSVLFISILLIALLSGCASSTTSQSTYERIVSEGEMTFAMTGAYPPFNYIDENGELAGFDIDIANALAAEMGVTAVPITTDWDGIIGGLTGNRFDMIIGSMAITEERLEQVNFTNPYYYDGAQFFAQSTTGLTSIESLTDGRVGVVTGTTFQEYLSNLDNISEIVQFQSDVDNFKAVEQGRTDGLVTSKAVGARAPIDYGVDLVPVGNLLYSEEIGIAIRKEDTALLESVNNALNTIVENGSYDAISQKWFGTNMLEK
ncbi:MAG: polar amino acid transport system substrate-binding protein [Eubacteriaceae bacterium]|jgi:polar amino acid transport system substrate-binding protein|nr:polar amino acid transport system substrate-binding protein [Eubacteriaceae bacterium]MDK2905350.1 polar amino acid transport system substrate-binding protein [Eubacteriaceae bacterium]MDK2937050.1 polar amino acid transport system substrate-binding protein [Eubacteriaceae bacterium]MDN5307916.1 polar amino acid transport system substrate-binding protein [Eubacteriaceae bacterium]